MPCDLPEHGNVLLVFKGMLLEHLGRRWKVVWIALEVSVLLKGWRFRQRYNGTAMVFVKCCEYLLAAGDFPYS